MSGPAPTDDLIGATIDGRYRVVELIGNGAMGAVYRGERVHLGRAVAIKVLHDSLPNELSARARFEHEARAMARLEHPHCVAVLDVGIHDGRPYVVMELVSGESLRSVLDRGPLDVNRATTIARQMLSGLAHAHELGIIHRDIKPANLMLSHKTGLGDQVKILDFGLARTLDAANVRLTTGLVLGTPSYMSPEQCRDASVDTRSDLYACGVVLFEMLTGEKPFQSEKDDPIEVVGMHMHKPPPRLADVAPGLELGALEPVVARALAKQPGDRYATAGEFADAIEAAMRGDTLPVARLDPHDLEIEAAPAVPPAPPVPLAPPPPPAEPMPAVEAPIPAAPAEPPSDAPVSWTDPRADATEPVMRANRRPWYAAAAAGGAILVVALIAKSCGSSSTQTAATTRTVDAAVAQLPVTPPLPADAHAPAVVDAPAIVAVIDAAAFVEPSADDPAGRALFEANQRVAAKDVDGALRILATAHAAYSANPDIPYMAGRLFLEKGRYHDGIVALRSATELFPGYREDPELARLVVQAFLATPTRNAEIARFLHDLGDIVKPFLRDAAATNQRAADELRRL